MAKVLIINATVSEEHLSYSIELSKRFVNYYKQYNPNDEFIYLDLNKTEMAQIALTVDNAKTFFNEKDSDYYIDQLKSVDKVIVNCPMNNFNVSGIMKNYLDHVLVANKTFSYKYVKKGDAIGLLPHLKVQILTTQGAPYGWYLWGNHTEYLRGTFEFVGATVTEPILVAGTKTAPYKDMNPKEVIDEFDSKIKELASQF